MVTTFGSRQRTKSSTGQASTWRPSISRSSSGRPQLTQKWLTALIVGAAPASVALTMSSNRRALAILRSDRPDLTETQLQLQYFEDLPLGGEWTTRRRTVTESDLSLFSGLVGDFSPLVVDAEHAAASHFGGRVASGPFLVATAIGLGSMDTPLPQSAGLVGMTWRFLKPARAGDTLNTVWRLARKRPVENPMKGWSGLTRIQKRRACSARASVSGGGTQTLRRPKYS